MKYARVIVGQCLETDGEKLILGMVFDPDQFGLRFIINHLHQLRRLAGNGPNPTYGESVELILDF